MKSFLGLAALIATGFGSFGRGLSKFTSRGGITSAPMSAREKEIFEKHKNSPKPKFSSAQKKQLAKLSGREKKEAVKLIKGFYETL